MTEYLAAQDENIEAIFTLVTEAQRHLAKAIELRQQESSNPLDERALYLIEAALNTALDGIQMYIHT